MRTVVMKPGSVHPARITWPGWRLPRAGPGSGRPRPARFVGVPVRTQCQGFKGALGGLLRAVSAGQDVSPRAGSRGERHGYSPAVTARPLLPGRAAAGPPDARHAPVPGGAFRARTMILHP